MLKEILESIFIDCARDYHTSSEDSDFPTWVNVSYVCRHWRNVALNCPILWSYLFVVLEDWTDESLARSGQAPLKLRMKTDNWDENSGMLYLVEQVMNDVERIQELRLKLPAKHTREVLSMLSSRAPRLQNLEISTRLAFEPFSVLPLPFGGDAPDLRTLRLSNCPVPWHSFKLSGLTELGLYDVPLRFRQTMQEFIVALRCMQDLAHLYLKNALASAAGFLSSTAFQTFQKSGLPRLCKLFISAPLSTVIALVSCVNIPLQAQVGLFCDFEHGFSLDEYVPHFSFLAQTLSASEGQAPSSSSICSLSIATLPLLTIFTFGSTEREFKYSVSPPRLKWSPSVSLQITLLFSLPITQDIRDRIVSDICCSVPLTNVQKVYVSCPPFSSALWKKILGHLPNLRHLKLSKGNMPDLASILSIAPHEHTANLSIEVQIRY